jgi:hypothetical protein
MIKSLEFEAIKIKKWNLNQICNTGKPEPYWTQTTCVKMMWTEIPNDFFCGNFCAN